MGSPRWARDLYASPPTPLLLILGPIVLLHVLVEQFRRWWRGAPKHLPPCADELLKQPATALASKIRRGELTSRELTDRCIARLEQIEPQLNGVGQYDLSSGMIRISVEQILFPGCRVADATCTAPA